MENQELDELCRKAGLRITDGRREILRQIIGFESPFSAAQLHLKARARLPNVDLTTIYRNIVHFEASGLLNRFSLSADQTLYLFKPSETQSEIEGAADQFIACRLCRKVQKFVSKPLRFIAAQKTLSALGFTEVSATVEFNGVCADCGPESAEDRLGSD